MNYYEVSMVGSVGAYYDVLTYQSEMTLSTGTVVSVPVGKRTSLGVITKKVTKPDFDCKEIVKSVTDTPIPHTLIELHDWMTEYYATTSGMVWQTILPKRVATKPRSKSSSSITPTKRTQILLNNEQQQAIAKIRQISSGTILLHGVTGSGKTEVYKAAAQDAINNGQSALILVPEISLTTQLVNEFRSQLDNVVVTHSAMTDSERNVAWRQILTSHQPVVVIGPRSALFMPIQNLGLIVIDECHEPSYKQEQSPRYHAITVASQLTRLSNAKLILGSATPAISDYHLAKHLDRPIITMNKLAVNGATKPDVKIVNLTNRDSFTLESKLFTKPLLDAIRQAIKDGRQTLLFHNRRGTASLAICEDCGYTLTCPNCYTPLTLHGDKFQLLCHLCGHTERPPLKCPDCHEPSIIYKGIGTKQIEEETKKLFPTASIRRFDGDTLKGEAVQDVYDELRSGKTDIIIGTQTIAKGLDLPHLAVVGVIQADAGLALPDFSSSERTFQLIAQVCGRVGRHELPTTAIIQTYQPQADAVKYGSKQDYLGFYEQEIIHRKIGHFPPYSHLLKLTCSYKTEQGAVAATRKLANQLRRDYGQSAKLLGPAPAFYERLRGQYCWQIVVRASKRTILTKIAGQVASSTSNWQIELDPISLI